MTPLRRRLLVATAFGLIAVSAVLSSACGGGSGVSSTPSPQPSSVVSPSVDSQSTAPATLDIAARLLVVRKESTAWRLLRLSPATGAEEALGTLPFRPSRAIASPGRERVLYWNDGRGLAVAEVETGAVTPISLAGLPVRSIDGATWTSEERILFGGSRTAYPSPEESALYEVDLSAGTVSSFRGLEGGEPSYASDEGSLIYVTRRTAGETAHETIWRLRSLHGRPRPFARDAAYVDAGRLFNAPLLSPDGGWVLSARTGTDVSVTYSLYDVRTGQPALERSGGSPVAAAWGGGTVAFQQSRPGQARLVVFVYDTSDGSLTVHPSANFASFDWSVQGDLVGGSWVDDGVVCAAAASNLGEWVDLGAGLVPVWVQ